MKGEAIAARALAQLGTPFRLHGRVPGVALDCVGLTAEAIGNILSAQQPLPEHYNLRGSYEDEIACFLEQAGFAKVANDIAIRPGDIVLACVAPRQLHLMIAVNGGFVHSHAGLRKIVFTPGPSPWPMIGRWRMKGE